MHDIMLSHLPVTKVGKLLELRSGENWVDEHAADHRERDGNDECLKKMGCFRLFFNFSLQ